MDRELRFCFLAERQVGIGSAAGAIEPHIRKRPGSTWTDVTYVEKGGLVEKLPIPPKMRGTLRGFLQSGEALGKGPYDALFFLTHNPAVVRQWALDRTPTLLWTDVTPALLDSQAAQYNHSVDAARSIRAAKHALVRRCFHKAKMCVGWSEWARQSFVRDYGVPVSHTAVVPPGVDLGRWTLPGPDDRKAPGLPRLLFVGGDFARKGGRLLLDVFRSRLRGRCALDIVTRDPVGEEEGVRVHHGLTAGSAPLLALYRAATAFVLPTEGDCFSIASLEAMAMGVPVIVSAVGGIPEIVESGGSGYLIPPGDGAQLGDAIDALLAHPARTSALGARGRKLVEERYDARKTADRLLDLLASIVRR